MTIYLDAYLQAFYLAEALVVLALEAGRVRALEVAGRIRGRWRSLDQMQRAELAACALMGAWMLRLVSLLIP